MTTASRSELILALNDLPEETSFEQAIERFALLASLRQRAVAADGGEFASDEQVRERLARWRG